MFRASLIAASAALAFLPATTLAQASSVDLDRFDGRWFEIERNHNTIQKDCSRAQIDFAPLGAADRYAIAVACTRLADGRVEVLRANARVTDTTTNAKFRFSLTGLLSFGGLAGQNYWVYDHAPDYSWAIMGLPDKSNWWIWHRNQNASQVERDRILVRVRALGFPTGRLVHTGL
ncbi:lipocalin family protein [uncultured Brevundimonas sp.]|uniref:lipocalin family protein n=1 Tax=Brevundimonas sp. EYE_349 TaxID=2853455 RepID=UPI002006D67A|nr:lipocalin family protein [uncultured Brevundimonas sp.]